MSKKKKRRGGAFGGASDKREIAVPFKNPPEMDAAWLAQFTPVDEATLTESQAEVLADFRSQYPSAKVGTREGGRRLSIYAIDAIDGPVAGDLRR